MPSLKAKSKAKGSFFADKATLPYTAKGVIRAQATAESCVPAVCRMLIFDRFPELEEDLSFSETYLRSFLQTDADGSAVAAIPAALRLAGITDYEYRADLTWEQLRQAVARGSAVASVQGKFGRHVLIVEEITAEHVALRDSLPDQQGSSYLIGIENFRAVWQSQKTARGSAVIVVR